MSLFEVEGWKLPSKVVAGEPEKKKKSAQKSAQKSNVKRKAEETEQKKPKKVKSEKRTKVVESKKTSGEVEEDIQLFKNDAEKSQPKLQPRPETKLTPLQLKMKEKLSGSRFRWINEQLYTISSGEALKLIENSPELFDEYHNGFRAQVQSWPENPVDTFIKQFRTRLEKPINAPGGLTGEPDGKVVIADMGCGEAQLALEVSNLKGSKKSKKVKFVVHSFDLKKSNDRITVADIKNVPLPDSSVHVVVFCLALMGTNFLDFIREANRILKPRGELWIAEIKSRFVDNNVQQFVDILKKNGFFHKTTDESNKMFVRFEFFKPPKDILEQRKTKDAKKLKFIDEDEPKEPEGKWLLKPCIYKKR
jgi:ribosomal RNA-processing protein 8